MADRKRWRRVPGWPGYKVSSRGGQVRSVPRVLGDGRAHAAIAFVRHDRAPMRVPQMAQERRALAATPAYAVVPGDARAAISARQVHVITDAAPSRVVIERS